MKLEEYILDKYKAGWAWLDLEDFACIGYDRKEAIEYIVNNPRNYYALVDGIFIGDKENGKVYLKFYRGVDFEEFERYK